MRAVAAACRDGRLHAEFVLVVSNNGDSAAIAWAKDHGIGTRHISAKTEGTDEQADAAIAAALTDAGADLVILAGYMRMLGPKTLGAFRGRILNVHPALLPKFGGKGMYGKRVHAAVLASGDPKTGATMHVVDEEYDHGPIVAQAAVPVAPGDTPGTLAVRVQEREKTLYVETLLKIISGEIDLDDL